MKLDALGRSRRYMVDITPVMSLEWGSTPSGGPYQKVDCDRFTRFPGKDVTDMNNGSFTFLYSPGIDMYSYYVKGFTVNKNHDSSGHLPKSQRYCNCAHVTPRPARSASS